MEPPSLHCHMINVSSVHSHFLAAGVYHAVRLWEGPCIMSVTGSWLTIIKLVNLKFFPTSGSTIYSLDRSQIPIMLDLHLIISSNDSAAWMKYIL